MWFASILLKYSINYAVNFVVVLLPIDCTTSIGIAGNSSIELSTSLGGPSLVNTVLSAQLTYPIFVEIITENY